ncbi:hypothetical protein GCM10027347_27180 [Larkinella harenae]
MNDELKPLWNAYKDKIGEQAQWSEGELFGLLENTALRTPWYKPYQHMVLNFCVGFLLLGITSGC